MVIRRSPRAAKALAFLKRPYNDIDIYVEDTGNRNMWLAIIKSMLPIGVKLQSLNLLGGKDRVIEACKLDQADDGRRKLHIIDADFDLALGKAKPRLKHFYRIRAYCVENLLINENSLVNIGLIFNPTWDEQRVAAELQFDSLRSHLNDRLSCLFRVYAVAYSLNNRIRTVGNSVRHLLIKVGASVELCPKKIWLLTIKTARSVCKTIGLDKFLKTLKK